jgi:flagellar FliL protein
MVTTRSTNAGENGAAIAYTLPLETFVVNLGGGDRAYLRVGIALALSHVPARKEEMPVALIRDTILSTLSTARAQQLAQADGKEKLKAEILQALKDRAPQLGVRDVYFTEFLVQM